MAEAPFLSIVIVNWNGGTRLRECLSALANDLRNGAHEGVEVLVVDNASEDDSLAAAAGFIPDAVFLELPANLGFAGGANAGIQAAVGEWVATLNNDVQVEAGWITAMSQAARECAASCGMLQPCMLRQDSADRVDTTGVVVRRGGEIEDRDRGKALHEASPAGEVFCVSAGASWYRRSMLDAVAPDGRVFDPDYFMYFEDVDLGWRCRLAGWSAEYVADAAVLHELHGSAEAHADGFVKRQCTRNRIRTVLANGSARYVVGAVFRLAKDVGWLIVNTRQSAVGDIGRALRAGIAARRALPVASRRARLSVEATWFGPR